MTGFEVIIYHNTQCPCHKKAPVGIFFISGDQEPFAVSEGEGFCSHIPQSTGALQEKTGSPEKLTPYPGRGQVEG